LEKPNTDELLQEVLGVMRHLVIEHQNLIQALPTIINRALLPLVTVRQISPDVAYPLVAGLVQRDKPTSGGILYEADKPTTGGGILGGTTTSKSE
jgi:hypothetical protein